MNEIIFIPKHNWLSLVFLGILFVLLGAAFFVGGIVVQSWFTIILGFGLVLLGILSILGRTTKIIIRDKDVVVKRLLFPDYVFLYKDYVGFDGHAYIFGNFGIRLEDMTNAQDFAALFSKVLEERNVRNEGNNVAEASSVNKIL